MTVNAPAPKMGRVSAEEWAECNAWSLSLARDRELWESVSRPEIYGTMVFIDPERAKSIYIIVRALRAGVPLEKLL